MSDPHAPDSRPEDDDADPKEAPPAEARAPAEAKAPAKAVIRSQVPPGETPALELIDIKHAFKSHQALGGVSFQVPQRAIHGFVGPNGAGKTTSLKIIATLLKQDRGVCRVFGIDTVKKVYEVRRRIGFMPDHFSMYRQMTVFEYLDFFAAAYGLSYKQRNKVIDDVLMLTDMGGRKDSLIQGLSRGMQQRVSLARLLVNDPQLLLLDEPASGLDPRARIELMEIIRELRNLGKTIFISSHILSELADLCDSVTIIDRGRVKYSGKMEDLLRHESGELRYEVHLHELVPDIEAALTGLPGVLSCQAIEGRPVLNVGIDPEVTSRRQVIEAIFAAGGDIVQFRESQRQLNQVFMELTEAGVRS